MNLWGYKTNSMFDVWSIEHILAGIAFMGTACLIFRLCNSPLKKFAELQTIFGVLTLSFLWEVFEHYLEAGDIGNKKVEYWFQGVEHWSNRMIGDSLAVLLGAYLYFKWPKILWPLKTVSIVWLLVHIFVFPHSMYLQQFF